MGSRELSLDISSVTGSRDGESRSEGSLDSPLGYSFEDRQTRKQLELIDDLQKLRVSQYIDLPQLVVVGEQSAGKSSVLQAVTEIPFPVHDNMCTRFATEVVLKRTSANMPTRVDVSIIPDANDSEERRNILRAWRPDAFDSAEILTDVVIKHIFRQAENILFDKKDDNKRGDPLWTAARLSNATLQITRSGPNETNFAIVDIPGLIRDKPKRGGSSLKAYETARHLVQKYTQNPQSIIVVVLDITHPDRQEIFQMLEHIPDQESRVIGVINKCDRKQAQSDSWVFDLLHNANRHQSTCYLKEGWDGLRNRLPAEAEISDEERDEREQTFFDGDDWSSLEKDILGRHHLKKALMKMRNRHVKRSVPKLLSDIQNKLDICVSSLEKLGEPRTSNATQFTLISKIATKYSMMAEGALNGHYEVLSEHPDPSLRARKRIRDDYDTFQSEMVQSGLVVPFRTSEEDAHVLAATDQQHWAAAIKAIPTYSKISRVMKDYRAKEDVGEINPVVKDYLWEEQTVNWGKTAADALERIEGTISLINTGLFEAACPERDIRVKLQNLLQDEFEMASRNAKNEMRRIVLNEREAHLFTLHPSKREKQQNHQNARVQATIALYAKNDPRVLRPNTTKTESPLTPAETNTIVNSLIYQDAEVVGILNTHDSLAAYYDVALYRFIDNFALQVIERHLLGPDGPLRLFNPEYVTQKLYGEKNAQALDDLAGENEDVARRRTELEAERASLEKSKKRVQSFKVL